MFGSKEICSICGAKPGAFSKLVLQDGVICGDCIDKCCQHLSHPRQRTVANIQNHLSYCARNREALRHFQTTDQIGEMYVDSIHKIWFIDDTRRKEIRNPLIFQYSQLLDYTVTEDGNTIQKSGAGRAVAGGLLFGGIGLVAGGLSGRKTKETVKRLSITVQVSSEWVDEIEIPFITVETKKYGMFYNMAKDNLDKTISLLNRILHENSARSASKKSMSAADELIKYKSLMDSGAISKEEFEAVKKKLLGI